MPNIHVLTGAGESPAYPVVRKIGVADLKDVLAKGIDDFLAMPTHVIFLAIIYPLVGLFLAGITFGHNVVPLLYPLAAGFALVGPFAAIGLYELSRQRERGVEVSWKHAFGLLRYPSLDAIAAMGLVLMSVFLSLARHCRVALSVVVRLPVTGIDRAVPQRHLHHARGLDPHHRRKRHRLPVRRSRAEYQRRFLPAAPGSGCRRGCRDAHVGQGGSSQSPDDGGLGPLRRRRPGDRLVAAFRWTRGGVTGARPFDLASVPQARGTGPEPATGPPPRSERTALCCRFPSRSLALDPRG